MPPSRRQPPRSSTPPARRPRVAGLRKPSSADAAPASTDELPTPAAAPSPSPSVSPSPAKHRSRPVPRPGPLTSADPSEVTQEIRFPKSAGISRSRGIATDSDAGSTDADVTAPVEDETEVDALTGETLDTEDAEDTADTDAPLRTAPRRKRRDSGRAKPTDADEFEQHAAGAGAAGAVVPPPWARPPGRDRSQALIVVLLVVGLVFVGGAVFFKLGYDDVADSTSNTALLDVAKTAQVKDQVSKATEALFSYDFNNIKKTEDAANGLLANDEVKAKYNSLMGEVKRLAPQQKMVVTCKVTRSAVIMLNGDLARVMVFVDQTSTRADTKQTTAGSAQLHVDAQLQGDTWKITDLDTYKAPAPPAANPPASAPASAPPPSK
ncbi:hypothetical protein VSH64_40845 [Amycolatopsis rhabdoformis]|uniref:Mce-associated membrane protein n=1 Tax=Amycolatopsis rhabdoformis TaxID=1448059 RepID=A0ABZ1I3W4_9PSEU|nr:hypothetical protein [Amycolatopsis rhabdoformis]WSE29099.1 hypothetical protein VSH64_40845 [Amycolatopsis rhabdoformis]